MTPKFQIRLVGAIVLFAVGVIILPDVFDGKKQHFEQEIPSIPLQSEMDVDKSNIVIKQPVSVDDVILPKEVITDITTDNQVITKIELPDEFSEAAWVIRLGTFRNHENANQLVEKLRTQGFTANIRPRKLKEGDLARVEVGPEVSEKKIVAIREELEKITGLKGQVMKFNPITL